LQRFQVAMLHAARHGGQRDGGDITRSTTRHEDHAAIGERKNGVPAQRHAATGALFHEFDGRGDAAFGQAYSFCT